MFIDLDDFKTVNDSLGHAAGDELLMEVARHLRTVTDGTATVGRLGGDEFAVVIENAATTSVRQAADRLLTALTGTYVLSGRPVAVRGTIGWATGDSSLTSDIVLRNADLAMYAAKKSGSDRPVAFAPDMHRVVLERLDLENDLRRAVDDGTLDVHYQPIVERATGAIVGFEALARWHHPTRGTIPPGRFIPIAEDCGLIDRIGELVLHRACVEAMRWQSIAPQVPPRRVSVNLSRIELRDPRVVGYVAAALEVSGLPAPLLTLEITESVLVERGEELRGVLDDLLALGVRLAVDDFGTGYSSLASLAPFPVDTLKIDRAFVDQAVGSDDKTAVLRSVIDLAHSLKLEPVAEGVELEDQRQLLGDLGCRLAQGVPLREAAAGSRRDDAPVRVRRAGRCRLERARRAGYDDLHGGRGRRASRHDLES